MIIKNNSDGDKWIDITNNLILFKKHNKTKVICWKASGGFVLVGFIIVIPISILIGKLILPYLL